MIEQLITLLLKCAEIIIVDTKYIKLYIKNILKELLVLFSLLVDKQLYESEHFKL